MPEQGRQDFPRRCRLRTSADFARVFENPVKSSDHYLTVLARQNHLGYPRLGLIIMKKRVRQAVQRNRIRRVARESFRCRGADLSSLDIIVLARNATAAADNSVLFRSLEKHWQRLESLCAAS